MSAPLAVVLGTDDALATVASEHPLDKALTEGITSGLIMAGLTGAGTVEYELTADGWLWHWSKEAKS